MSVPTDYESYDSGTPYYAWWVRLPAVEHARRGKDGLPLVLAPIREYLDGQVPGGLEWEISPDRELTYEHAASAALRTAYTDVINPFEQALMPLRIDGAADLEPRAKVWRWEDHLLVGTFDLWLCNDPDGPQTWLVVSVGLWTEPQLFDEEPAARLGHFDFTPHHPLLFLPRPPGPATFTARVTGGAFPHKSTSRTKAADTIGVAHQRTANDPAVPAARVRRDLMTLLPDLPDLPTCPPSTKGEGPGAVVREGPPLHRHGRDPCPPAAPGLPRWRRRVGRLLPGEPGR
ncbi:hypothetical protein ACF06X_33015 [Streptomyces sp. NPDC015346]|uniref:hypothetical protein n=1 Tax=Streptomyces sp. NPDC015346 TaxID=3364954 RepID=UPI0036F71DAA